MKPRFEAHLFHFYTDKTETKWVKTQWSNEKMVLIGAGETVTNPCESRQVMSGIVSEPATGAVSLSFACWLNVSVFCFSLLFVITGSVVLHGVFVLQWNCLQRWKSSKPWLFSSVMSFKWNQKRQQKEKPFTREMEMARLWINLKIHFSLCAQGKLSFLKMLTDVWLDLRRCGAFWK